MSSPNENGKAKPSQGPVDPIEAGESETSEGAVDEGKNPEAAEAPPGTSSFVMILTLAVAGLLAGLLLVVANEVTAPMIAKYKKEQQELAAKEVLGGEERIAKLEKYAFADGDLTLITTAEDGTESPQIYNAEYIFRAFDADGALLGYAIPGGEFGYADVIPIVIGYSPEGDKLLGLKVLGNKETPGLGTNIVDDEHFANQWLGKVWPLIEMKGNASAENEVDTISGATISSAAVIRGMNDAIEKFKPAIEALQAAGASQ